MSEASPDQVSTCPCGRDASLELCCGRFITGGQIAPTAEDVMRSRYTAYTIEEIDHIVNTHNPSSTDEVDKESALKWAQEAAWEGLEIVATEAGGPDDDQGVVEFIAKYAVEGKLLGHHERATFDKIDGVWYYTDGEMIKRKPVVRDTPKVGRNEPCTCGSGKKFKKCCGA